MLAAPAALAETSVTQYLHATGGYPKSDLLPAAPVGPLLNFDPLRDDEPGLYLQQTGHGAAETNPSKYQLWAMPVGAVDLDGPASLTISAAMEDFDDEDRGRLDAFLLDCPVSLDACTTIGSGSVSSNPWGPEDAFVTRTISFGDVTHQVAVGRRLAVKVVVNNGGSTADMMLAYGAGAYPSRLVYTEAEAAGSTTTSSMATTTSLTLPTTTTVTTPTTTTTAAPASTTTTAPPTTTTTAAPASTTSTAPPTTTTTAAPASTTTTAPPTITTTAAPASTTTAPTTASAAAIAEGPAPASTTLPRVEMSPPLIASGIDLALPTLADGPTGTGLSTASLRAFELFLPNGAAHVVVSPLMVLAVMADAMFLTGRSISLPAGGAGVLVALLIISSQTGRIRGEEVR